MEDFKNINDLILNLNALIGAFFILSALGIIASRQIGACMRFFIFQSIFLSSSALLLGIGAISIHLIIVGIISLITKVFILPWLLQRLLSKDIYTRREINQVVNIPTSLIIALILTISAYLFSLPWLKAVDAVSILRINVPIGLAGLFLGAFALTTRREAIPQLLGLLAMENGAFFAGITLAPDLPLIAELALAFDILVLTLVVGVLTHSVKKEIGTTTVGKLSSLKENP